ncbi:Probable Co/Zn/Cd efflux system membrane fusion protein [hydrothermal vent metagenome]|uniref:Probable Co/Zn/Cd efflux system membrane fusion protein n=1 Tax=hydrothermal vent metagenome TaxID=652676 RepID=A0A3B0R1P8_9ZZZZ
MKTLINKTMRITLLILLISLTLVNCSDKKETAIDNSDAVNVTIATPSSQKGGAFFSASGQIETEQFANISTRMMGYVSKIHVKVGDKVKKGQLLININNSDIEAKRAQANAGLNQAEAAFNIAEKDFKRFKKLYEQNSASQKEFDDITMRYEITKAQVESAKQMKNEINAMLSYSNIKAPFGGIITSKSINEGDMANPGRPLFSLEAQGKYVATALVPETEIVHINNGDMVEVFIKSSGEKLIGTVSEVSISSQNTGGQYLVKISLVNDNTIKLLSGMFVSTNFSIKNGVNNNITIPKSALINKGQLTGIYTVSKSDTAILRWLKLGKISGDQVEVLTGLSKDEKYIVSAEGKLYNGVKLNVK